MIRYSRVFLEALGYELPELTIKTSELEDELKSIYQALRIPKGQLEAMTGIHSRRWWPSDHNLVESSLSAGLKALNAAKLTAKDIDLIIYAGVCRQAIEPATACAVGQALGVGESTMAFDVSNACLGVLSAIVDAANRIELGQIRYALIVACESARAINEQTLSALKKQRPDLKLLSEAFATFTGGSGAVAVVLSDGSLGSSAHPLVSGVSMSDLARHDLCRWAYEPFQDGTFQQMMRTDAVKVMRYGIDLAVRTWRRFIEPMEGGLGQVNKVITHQVGQAHRLSILNALGLKPGQDFPTFAELGNMGSVSLPLSLAMALEHRFFKPHDQIGLLGIGSGLNCLMLGLRWSGV